MWSCTNPCLSSDTSLLTCQMRGGNIGSWCLDLWFSIQWLSDFWTRAVNLSLSKPSSTLVWGTAMPFLSWMCKALKRKKKLFFYVLYTRRPWCDRLWDLVTLHTQYYSTLWLKGRKEWIYWLVTLTRVCVSGLLLCGMIRLQWQGQVKLEQQKTSLTLTWPQGHS